MPHGGRNLKLLSKLLYSADGTEGVHWSDMENFIKFTQARFLKITSYLKAHKLGQIHNRDKKA